MGGWSLTRTGRSCASLSFCSTQDCSVSDCQHAKSGITARQAFQQFPEIKKQVWGGPFWSRSYYVGVTHLATLSNGIMIEHPRYYRGANQKLEQAHQRVSRRKKGSHRREKAKKQLGKAHRKVARQRRDFLHKQSRKLVNQYQVIVFEDIQIANLTKKPKPKKDENGKYLPNGAAAKGGLNTSILDAGWGMFMQMCTSKAEEAGRTLILVSPKFTSQICSGCGQVRKKDLSERWHSCDCGAELDRDVNAAKNILERGYQELARTEPTSVTV